MRKRVMDKKEKHKQAHKALSQSENRWGFCLALVAMTAAFAVCTATQFPYTYMTMEGDDFWVLTRDFWQLKLATLPAVTQWLADFLMQFYGSPIVAAGIEALILGAIGLLAHAVLRRTFSTSWLPWLGLLPPLLLGYYCTFSLAFMLQWLFLFALLLTYQLIPLGDRAKLLWSLLCVPLGFFLMRTPMLALLIVLQTLSEGKKLKAALGKGLAKAYPLWGGLAEAVLLVFAPLIYSQQVAFIPFGERYTSFGTYFDPLTSRYNANGEFIKKMAHLASEGRWEDLLYREHAKSEAKRGNSVALRYALLAESALGTLPENLLDYPIREEDQFLYPHETEYVALQFDRLFYLNLGIYDEAYHHAQEYGQLQPGGICFSSLRQMVDYSIEEGDFEVSEKFLNILARSSRHKSFIESRRKKLSDRRSSGQPGKQVSLRADNFVGGYPLPIEMLRLARYYGEGPGQKKMLDYAICSYLLRNDKESFIVAIQAFDIYKNKKLPRAYQEYLDR